MTNSSTEDRKPRWELPDRRLLTILLIVFVQMLGASMALPILPLFAKREFALDESIIPLLNFAFFFAQFIAGPYIGRLSDNYGRVPVLIVSQIGTVLAFGLIASSPSAWVLFFARALDGITGGNIVVAQAYVTDVTPPEKRTESLGLVFAAFGLGFIFGPALGSILSANFGPRIPFWFAATAASIVVILTYFILEESRTAEERAASQQSAPENRLREIWNMLKIQTVFYIIGIVITLQIGLGLVQSTFALWGDAILFQAYPENQRDIGIGLAISIVGFGQVITQITILPRLLKWLHETYIIMMGLALRAVGFFLFVLATSPSIGIVGVVLFAMGGGIAVPPVQSLVTKAVDETKKGFVLGLTQSATSIAIIISTLLAGPLFELTPQHNAQFWVGLGLTLISMIPSVLLIRWQAIHGFEEDVPEIEGARPI